MSKKDIGVFGHPSYIAGKFDGIIKTNFADGSKVGKELAELVASKATTRDGMRVLDVVRATVYEPTFMTANTGATFAGFVPGGYSGLKGTKERFFVHVGVGLNGPRKESAYLAAIKRLVDTKRFHLCDASIDATDDLWSFLFLYEGEEPV